jgi:hypothetical protein
MYFPFDQKGLMKQLFLLLDGGISCFLVSPRRSRASVTSFYVTIIRLGESRFGPPLILYHDQQRGVATMLLNMHVFANQGSAGNPGT